MPLSRQLNLIVSGMYLLVFLGTFFITVDNTRRYLVTQLASHAQDTATSLGLSLSMHIDDPLLMESMVDAVFDRGYYQEISVDNLEGAAIISRVLAVKVEGVPDWFVRLLPLPTPRESSNLMAGWRQGGHVHVRSHPGHAYHDLWSNVVEMLGWSLASLAAAILLTTLLLRLVLRSLRDVEAQALAVANREFPRVEKIPRTREFARVVRAMNTMVERVEAMLAEQYARMEQLRRTAYRDPVTGLGNQPGFERDLDRLVSGAEDHAFGAVALVRLQGLEAANRDGGYEAGDALLAAAATALTAALEPREGSLCRLGGALFSLILPGLPRSEYEAILDEVIGALRTVAPSGLEPGGVNAGAAYYGGGQTKERLLERAETALRNAEQRGANEWQVWDATETAAGRDVYHEDRWRSTLERVIEARAVVLMAQPVVSAGGDAEMQREVLARIRPGGGELVAAGLFFPMAVRVGLASALDRIIVESVMERLGCGAGAHYAVNLSRQSVTDRAFCDWLGQALAGTSGAGAGLAFEITEQIAVGVPAEVTALADIVRGAGAQFGVDHCGARDLALDYLKRLRADYIKVDGSYLRDIDRDPSRQDYVRALVGIGHGLGAVMVAEQVETAAERATVASLGFDAVQGHLIGMPAEMN